MKHHISITIRIDGGIEHDFSQVFEGEENTRIYATRLLRSISGITVGWRHGQRTSKEPWPGAARSILRQFVMVKGSAGTYKKGQEFDVEP